MSDDRTTADERYEDFYAYLADVPQLSDADCQAMRRDQFGYGSLTGADVARIDAQIQLVCEEIRKRKPREPEPRYKREPISPEQKAEIRDLLRRGVAIPRIAELMGLHPSSMGRLMQRLENRLVLRCKHCGSRLSEAGPGECVACEAENWRADPS